MVFLEEGASRSTLLHRSVTGHVNAGESLAAA